GDARHRHLHLLAVHAGGDEDQVTGVGRVHRRLDGGVLGGDVTGHAGPFGRSLRGGVAHRGGVRLPLHRRRTGGEQHQQGGGDRSRGTGGHAGSSTTIVPAIPWPSPVPWYVQKKSYVAGVSERRTAASRSYCSRLPKTASV